MKIRSQIIYFAFIAVLVLSENIGNIISLIGPLEETARKMGLSLQEERIRIVILIVLDAIPALGAVLAIWGYRRAEAALIGRIGVFVTTAGMLAYGVYQFWSATFQLEFMPNVHKLIGIVYAMFGIAAWFVGSDLRKGRSSPKQAN
jgi:hypothetical protein